MARLQPFCLICLPVLLVAAACSAVSAQDTTPRQPNGSAETTLADCIRIAVRNNVTIRNAYLDRIVQKYALRVAEDIFTPKMRLTSNITRTGPNTDLAGKTTSSGTTTTHIEAPITEGLPTGTTITLTPKHDFFTSNGTSRAYGWDATLTQPLLKGGGWDVNTASVRTARISEQVNILSLKATIMDTLTSVITDYRGYVQAIKALEISKQSLERGKELVAINRELIAAGRMAAVDMVQTEADVANREYNLLSSENSLDAARLALVKVLNLDKNTRITPTQSFAIEPIPFSLEQAKKLALANRPDYQSALLGLETAKINLMLAKNSTLWDLGLSATYGQNFTRDGGPGTTGNSDHWNAGLTLSIPFWDLATQQPYLINKIALQQTEINLAKQRDDLEIEVQDAFRTTEMNLRQVKLAQLSRELSQKKYEIESEKLKAGRSTNFQLVSFQNDLVNAQNNELNSIISYLNALTTLERTVGTTLDKWGITLAERHGDL